MNNVPKILEVDCSTGISTEREMTAAEIANMQEMAAAQEVERALAEAESAALAALKASARAKLVAGQPLTPEEADTLVI